MKIRCSQIGKIMTNPRKKGERLSLTTKSYILELAIQEKYEIQKEFWSRYTDKGNEVEPEAIKLTESVLDVGFIYKNEEQFENDWVTGKPDVNTDVLIDVKSSWDAFTFFDKVIENELNNKDYYYQLQGYMWLTNKQEALLCYCLVDTPLQIVEDEIRREHWKQNLISESDDVRAYIEDKHTFGHIPMEKRVKTHVVKRDEDVIEAIKTRIEECNEYYNEIIDLI
jgi:hypothetical protein